MKKYLEDDDSDDDSKDDQEEGSDDDTDTTITVLPKITIKERIEQVRNEAITRNVFEMSKISSKAVIQGFEKIFEKLSIEEKNDLLSKLSNFEEYNINNNSKF